MWHFVAQNREMRVCVCVAPEGFFFSCLREFETKITSESNCSICKVSTILKKVLTYLIEHNIWLVNVGFLRGVVVTNILMVNFVHRYLVLVSLFHCGLWVQKMRYHLLISNKLTRSYGKLSLIYHRANRIFYCSLVQQPHLFSLEIATFSYLGRCSSSSTMCLRHRPCLLCCPDDEALVYNSKVLCMRCFFFQI